MAIVAGDIDFHLTGASSDEGAQSDPDASLGNYKSSTEITSGADNNLFDDVSGAEAASGDTEYRAFGVSNDHGSLTWSDVVVWISVDTGNGEDDIKFDVESPSAETNGYIQTIVDESTAPTGLVGWSDATSKATGKACPNTGGDLDAGEWFGVWVQRIISAAASAAAAEAVTFRVEGDTPA
jgi:hypothetical protein